MEQNETKKEEINKGAQDIQKLQNRLIKNTMDIHISRIPKPTKKAFIELANEEFAGDYGMTLKWLMDDVLSADMRMVIEEINALKQRISNLEQSLIQATEQEVEQTKKDKVRKMLNGKEKQVLK